MKRLTPLRRRATQPLVTQAAALALALITSMAGAIAAPVPSNEEIAQVLRRAVDARDARAEKSLHDWADAKIASAQCAYGQYLLHRPTLAERARALPYLEGAATQGEAGCARQLAEVLRTGRAGLPANPARARHWYQQAATQGDAEAARYVGIYALDAPATPANRREAFKWLTRAADGGDGHAMFLLGNHFAGGKDKDLATALKWYRAAGDADFIPALETLAQAYERGELGLSPDPIQARLMRQEAAEAMLHHAHQ